jgi:hypothetical protein
MPRSGPGVYSLPANYEAVDGEDAFAAQHNDPLEDLEADANTPRPVVAGGTGEGTVIGGHDALNTKGNTVASAATINLDTATGAFVDISGTTTITAVTLADGKQRRARATGAFQITASANLIVNGSTSVNYTAVAGDLLFFEGYSSSVVRVWVIGRTAPNVLPAFGSSLQALRVNNAGTALEFASLTTNGTLVATTSGTAIDFTGIPAGVKRILVSLVGVSTSGSSALLLQIGDSGGVVTTGYAGGVFTSAADAAATSGWQLVSVSSGAIRHGTIALTLVNAATNTWACFGAMFDTGASVGGVTAGTRALSGALDRIRLTAANGTDTFDLGSMNIQYQY